MKKVKLSPSAVDSLLSELCVDLGFCLPPSHNARLIDNPPRTVEAFTNAVFSLEGLNPHHQPHRLLKAVLETVAKHFEAAASEEARDDAEGKLMAE